MSAITDVRTADPRAVDSSWILCLRWMAIVAQVLMIAAVVLFLKVPLPVGPVAVLLALGVATNLAAERFARRSRTMPPGAFALLTAIDLVTFTFLLDATGGAFNPFSFLYLVHLALAS